jgi:hypothetical protein
VELLLPPEEGSMKGYTYTEGSCESSTSSMGAPDCISTSSIVVGSFVTVANGCIVIDGYGVGSNIGGQLFEMRLVLLQISSFLHLLRKSRL